jgi:hypothetical protein
MLEDGRMISVGFKFATHFLEVTSRSAPCILGAVAIFVGGSMHTVEATILTFDQGSPVVDGQLIDQTYGDRVTNIAMPGNFSYGVGAEGFTPNVTVTYSGSAATPAIRTSGYADLTNVLSPGSDSSSVLEIKFVADPGYLVRWYSYEWGASLVDRRVDFSLFNSVNKVVHGSTGGAPDLVEGRANDTGYFANIVDTELRLVFDTAPLGNHLASDRLGIDNIVIGQLRDIAVPVPAALPLFATGLGIMGFVGWRRRKAA